MKCMVSSSSSLHSWQVLFEAFLSLLRRDWVRYVWVTSCERMMTACWRKLEVLDVGYRSWGAVAFLMKERDDLVFRASCILSCRARLTACLVEDFQVTYGIGLEMSEWRSGSLYRRSVSSHALIIGVVWEIACRRVHTSYLECGKLTIWPMTSRVSRSACMLKGISPESR